VKRVAALLVGLASAVLVLGGDRLFSALTADGLSPFDLAEIRTYDWRLTRTARPESARKDIAIVEIDEPSLRSLQPNAGRWPWPRAVHSMLLDYLARAPAKVIAYDVVFSEADSRLGFDFGVSLGHGFRHSLWVLSRSATSEECADIVEDRIGHRRDQERQEERQGLPPDDHHGDSPTFLRPWTSPDSQGQHARHQRQGSHENRTQPVTVGLHNGFQAVQTTLA
jgi:hypothetical protein